MRRIAGVIRKTTLLRNQEKSGQTEGPQRDRLERVPIATTGPIVAVPRKNRRLLPAASNSGCSLPDKTYFIVSIQKIALLLACSAKRDQKESDSLGETAACRLSPKEERQWPKNL